MPPPAVEADPVWSKDSFGGGGDSIHEFLGNAMDEWMTPPGRSAAPMLAVDIGWNGAMGAAFSKPILATPTPAESAAFSIPADWQAPPSAQAPIATPLPMPNTAPVAPAAGTPDWAAFCSGAGLDAGDLKLSPDAMHRLGVLYRQVVLGLTDLIQDRAAFKDEFRVERSMLMMGRNNPLKHIPPLDTARLLLGEPLPGFMSSEEAVKGAFEDIKKHQLAMLAGVQHALQSVFERLEPAEIERLIAKAAGAKKGLLDRKPDPWTVYRTVFEALRVDATNNVNSVMSLAFRDGYEAFMKAQAG